MLDIGRIRSYVQQGCCDPEVIAEKLGNVSPVEVAYHIDIECLLPATVDMGEVFEAETFPELVDAVPGILPETRVVLRTRYFRTKGAMLAAELLEESVQRTDGVILQARSREDLKVEDNLHYVNILMDHHGDVEVKYLSSSQSLQTDRYYRLYLGNGYEAAFNSLVLDHREAALERLKELTSPSDAGFVDCTPEETPVTRELEAAFWLAMSGKSPVACRFSEPFFIRWLSEHGSEALGSQEVRFLGRLLRHKGLSILTPQRAILYDRVRGGHKSGLTKIFFHKEDLQRWVSNMNALIDYVFSQYPSELVEDLPYAYLKERLPKPLHPSMSSKDFSVYLLKYYPGFGLLTPTKAQYILQEVVASRLAGKRPRLYKKSFFYDPVSNTRRRGKTEYSEAVVRFLLARGLENARTLIREYADSQNKRLEDLNFDEIELLFTAARPFSLCGLELPLNVRIIMNKLFPEGYGGLVLEDAIILLLHTDSALVRRRKDVYFDDGHEREEVYTPDELRWMKARCRNNARLAVRAYLLLHPEKTLDSLDEIDLGNISHRLLRIFGGKSALVCLNRLFPDQFLVLDQEKAIALLDAQGREKHALTMRYLPIRKRLKVDSGDSYMLYTEEDFERILERTASNVRCLFQTFMKRAGMRFLEELDCSSAEGFINWRSLHNAIPSRSDGSRNKVRLLLNLYPEEYGVLNVEKYRYWKQEANIRKKGYLSHVFFMLPDPRDGWSVAESKRSLKHSQQNAYFALEYYMREQGIDDINRLSKAMVERAAAGVPLYRVFEVPNSSYALLDRMFPQDFAVLTARRLREFFSLVAWQRIQPNRAYFGWVNSDDYAEYAERSGLQKKWLRNALLMMLWVFKAYNASWARFELERGKSLGPERIIALELSSSVYRLLGAAVNNLTELHNSIKGYFYPIKDPEEFFWLNIGVLTNLVQFFELDHPENIQDILAAPNGLLGIVCARVFEHGYPYAEHARNKGVIEAKVRLIQGLRNEAIKTIPQREIAHLFATACTDRYQRVRKAAWGTLGRLWSIDRKAVISTIRIVLQRGRFLKNDWLMVPDTLQQTMKAIGREVNQDMRAVLDLLGDEEDYHQAYWDDEYRLLVQALKRGLSPLAQRRGFEVSQSVDLAVEILSRELLFMKGVACRMIAQNIESLSVDSRAQLVPQLPIILLERDVRIRKDGAKILRALRLAAPGFSVQDQRSFSETLRDIKEQLLRGRF